MSSKNASTLANYKLVLLFTFDVYLCAKIVNLTILGSLFFIFFMFILLNVF